MNENKDNNNIYIDLHKVPLKSEREENKKRRRSKFLRFLLCLLCFGLGIGGTIAFYNYFYPKKYKNYNAMSEVEYVLDNYWLYANDYENLSEELQDKALYGMSIFEEDLYTTYMSKDEQESFYSSINMDYVGIGIEYLHFNDEALVTKVFNNSPAQKAGILEGDIIKEVDGKSINGLSTQEIKDLVLGEKGSKVVISVLRGSELLDLTCIRDEVSNTVFAYAEDDYLVLEISSFGASTYDECLAYLNKYSDLTKIIIDIRNNSGGLQTACRDVCSLFIGKDKVYLKQEDGRGNIIEAYTNKDEAFSNYEDVVILINEQTASAAEVFAICMKQQYPNVTLVGTTSYGKGVIQSQKNLSNGGVLKYTSYYWYAPNGESINKEGIKPDVEKKMDDIYYETYNNMSDEDTYEVDSVSDFARISELSLKTLGYDVNRVDGYFDESFALALNEFKKDNNLSDDSILDKQTYEAIISSISRELSVNEERDYQMLKAKEIINNGNQY